MVVCFICKEKMKSSTFSYRLEKGIKLLLIDYWKNLNCYLNIRSVGQSMNKYGFKFSYRLIDYKLYI